MYLSRMSLLTRLALLFVGVPLLELLILIQVGQVVGLWPTIGLVVLTGMAGAALARVEGLRTLLSIQGELARGRIPGDSLMDGLGILLGGALLLTPGILTDLLGFSFLVKPTRRLLLARIRKALQGRLESGVIQVSNLSGFPGGMGWGSVHPRPPGGSGPGTQANREGEIVVEAPGETDENRRDQEG